VQVVLELRSINEVLFATLKVVAAVAAAHTRYYFHFRSNQFAAKDVSDLQANHKLLSSVRERSVAALDGNY